MLFCDLFDLFTLLKSSGSTASVTSAKCSSPSVGSPEDVQEFRDLLNNETNRMTSLCNEWETKISSIPEDQSYEEMRGEVRSVVGQGRLVMAERFHQFSGLVDNCQFGRGEKKTTTEDLRGFWEMIYLQVLDVDKKFTELVKVEARGWKHVPKPSINKTKTSNPTTAATSEVVKKCKKASSGLKSLIAARRKAAKLVTQEPALSSQSQNSEKTTWRNNTDPAYLEPADDKTFDGGFFTVKSPMSERKSPRSCKSSSNKLRHTAVTNSAKCKKANSFLLSPFISAMAKLSLSSSASPTSCSTTSVLAASPSKPPKPIILFKDTAEDEEVTAEEVVIVEEIIYID